MLRDFKAQDIQPLRPWRGGIRTSSKKLEMRRLFVIGTVLSLGACVTGPQVQVYGPAGAQMLSQAPVGTFKQAGGTLIRRQDCLIIAAPDGEFVPIWPVGTRLTQEQVIMPGTSKAVVLPIGDPVWLSGRYVFARDGSLQRSGATAARLLACGDRGFLVSEAKAIPVLDTVAKIADASDAVVLAQVVEVNFSDFQRDQFLTSLRVRVIDPLRGAIRPGDELLVRLPLGRSPDGYWQVPAHDYGLFGPSPTRLQPGEQLLLFLSREAYEEQARVRGGEPLPGRTGAARGLYRVLNGKIAPDGDLQLPATIEGLKRAISRD